MCVGIYPPAGTKFSRSLIIPTSEKAMSPGQMHDFPPLPFFLSWPDRPCVGRLIISALLSSTDYYQSSDAQVTMVTSFNKSVQPRNCEATRSCPTEKGNTLSRAAAYVTEHRQALHANFCEILPACCRSLLYPTRAFSSRAGTLGRSQWVPGPPAFWLTQGQAPGAQASGSGGRARDIPSGFPQGPGRSSGLGNAGG